MKTNVKVLTTIILIVWTVIGSSQLQASKIDMNVEQAFTNYDRGEEILSSKARQTREELNLDWLIAHPDAGTIPETLQVLLRAKENGKASDLEKLNLLYEIHSARTFKAKYPDTWQFVKAKDYEQMLCKRIMDVITMIKTQSENQDKGK